MRKITTLKARQSKGDKSKNHYTDILAQHLHLNIFLTYKNL